MLDNDNSVEENFVHLTVMYGNDRGLIKTDPRIVEEQLAKCRVRHSEIMGRLAAVGIESDWSGGDLMQWLTILVDTAHGGQCIRLNFASSVAQRLARLLVSAEPWRETRIRVWDNHHDCVRTGGFGARNSFQFAAIDQGEGYLAEVGVADLDAARDQARESFFAENHSNYSGLFEVLEDIEVEWHVNLVRQTAERFAHHRRQERALAAEEKTAGVWLRTRDPDQGDPFARL